MTLHHAMVGGIYSDLGDNQALVALYDYNVKKFTILLITISIWIIIQYYSHGNKHF